MDSMKPQVATTETAVFASSFSFFFFYLFFKAQLVATETLTQLLLPAAIKSPAAL